LPIALRANWIFRLTELRDGREYSSAVRRTLFILGVLPVWVATAALLLFIFPFGVAVGHLLVLGLLGTILVEICLQGFKKIPFTCSYLPGKGKIPHAIWICLLLLLPLLDRGAEFERRMLEKPLSFVLMVVVLGILAACARWRSTAVAKSAPGLRFDEMTPPDIIALKLHRD